MKTDEEIQKILETAKQRGIASVVIDGVTYNLYKEDIVTNDRTKVVPDLEAKDIVAPMSPFDDLSEDEVMYWHSPYGSELEAMREMRKISTTEGVD